MRMIGHTLRKDLRRLWPAIAIAWAMLAVLSWADRWRADWTTSAMEGWLTMLLSLAWALLAALAVLEEPLVGDAHFWMTRPHRWPSLVAAKLAFAIVSIHLPSLVGDMFVLAARGFPPFPYLGTLAWKQFLFFAAVVLPAMAIASVVRSFTHFVIAMLAIAGGLAMLNGGLPDQGLPWLHEIGMRQIAIRTLVALAAAGVLWVQYAYRRVAAARALAMAGMLAAAAISAWLPARAEYEAATRQRETPRVTFRDAAPADSSVMAPRYWATQVVLLPIQTTPAAPDQAWRFAFADVEIVENGDTRLRTIRPSSSRRSGMLDLNAFPVASPQAQTEFDRQIDWLALSFSASAWEQVKAARVRVRGSIAFDLVRRGAATGLSLQGAADAPGVGRCSVMEAEGFYSGRLLKVLCESPREIPATIVILRHDGSARRWVDRLNSSTSYHRGPHATWLSPLHRAQVFFPVQDSVDSSPDSRWIVPAQLLPSTRLEIMPEFVTGHALARFDLGEVHLADWRMDSGAVK